MSRSALDLDEKKKIHFRFNVTISGRLLPKGVYSCNSRAVYYYIITLYYIIAFSAVPVHTKDPSSSYPQICCNLDARRWAARTLIAGYRSRHVEIVFGLQILRISAREYNHL